MGPSYSEVEKQDSMEEVVDVLANDTEVWGWKSHIGGGLWTGYEEYEQSLDQVIDEEIMQIRTMNAFEQLLNGTPDRVGQESKATMISVD